MSRIAKLVFCAFAVVAIAGAAHAATVDLVLTSHQTAAGSNAGWWTLEASASLGDNFGIAGYNIEVVGNKDAVALGPKATNQTGFKAMGFTVNNADFSGDGAVFAGQNSTDVASLIRGIGQTAWADAFAFFPTSENASDGTPTIPYGVPVMLAKGTSDDYLAVNWGQSRNANVWTADTGVNAVAAEVNAADPIYVPIPEPAALAILGIAFVGLVGLRRRLG